MLLLVISISSATFYSPRSLNKINLAQHHSLNGASTSQLDCREDRTKFEDEISEIAEEIHGLSSQTATLVRYIHAMRHSEADESDLFKDLLQEYAVSDYTIG